MEEHFDLISFRKDYKTWILIISVFLFIQGKKDSQMTNLG